MASDQPPPVCRPATASPLSTTKIWSPLAERANDPLTESMSASVAVWPAATLGRLRDSVPSLSRQFPDASQPLSVTVRSTPFGEVLQEDKNEVVRVVEAGPSDQHVARTDAVGAGAIKVVRRGRIVVARVGSDLRLLGLVVKDRGDELGVIYVGIAVPLVVGADLGAFLTRSASSTGSSMCHWRSQA